MVKNLMKYSEYVDAIVKFDKYPPTMVAQPTVYFEGLVGECGEVCDSLNTGFNGVTSTTKLMLEAGDYMWYWTRLGVKLNIPILEMFDNTLEYIAFHKNTSDQNKLMGNFVSHTCKVVEQHKKAIRDDAIFGTQKGYQFTINRLGKIEHEMKLALHQLCYILRENGLNMKTVLGSNIDKLTKRLNNNTIHGSDDDGTRTPKKPQPPTNGGSYKKLPKPNLERDFYRDTI